MIRALCVFLAVFVMPGGPAIAGPSTPSKVVSEFQAGLLQTMKQARKLGLRGRYDALEPVIARSFHQPLMIATASAPFWKNGSPKQRAALLTAFERMSVASTATLFDDYNGETFHVVRERKSGGPVVLVDTQVLRNNKDPIDITYVTARLGGRWWIIDIIVGGGVSELKVRRAEYLALLEAGGIPALTRALSHKAERLLSGKEKAAAAGAGD